MVMYGSTRKILEDKWLYKLMSVMGSGPFSPLEVLQNLASLYISPLRSFNKECDLGPSCFVVEDSRGQRTESLLSLGPA